MLILLYISCNFNGTFSCLLELDWHNDYFGIGFYEISTKIEDLKKVHKWTTTIELLLL